MRHVVVLSGGLDSTTLLYLVRDKYPDDEILTISFDYGQRHRKELFYAGLQAHLVDAIDAKVVNLADITDLFKNSGSSLVTDEEVPEGHYAADNMKATVVPNRNMIMMSIAIGYAVAEKADHVWAGVHAGDHFIYPDCRPPFFAYLDAAAMFGNQGFGPFEGFDPETMKYHEASFIRTPFIQWSKNEIAYEALRLGVPIEKTWSCYQGGEKHCGKCGTCVERLEAMHWATDLWNGNLKHTKRQDPTEYEDKEYWKGALSNG